MSIGGLLGAGAAGYVTIKVLRTIKLPKKYKIKSSLFSKKKRRKKK